MRRTRTVLLFLVLTAAGEAVGATWHVDAAQPHCPGSGAVADPFCSIQAAIAASAAGDTILVAPGVYLENLDFLGKDIEVVATGGPGLTTLDGQQAGSCVRMTSNEGPGATLRGFFVTNGRGTLTPYRFGQTVLAGAGVYCSGSSPSILDNVFSGNGYAGPFVANQVGLSVFCQGGSPRVAGNVVFGQWADEGAGVLCWQGVAPRIEDNRFENLDPLVGGGAMLVECAQASVAGNEFVDIGYVIPFGGYSANAGAGVYAEQCGQLELRDNVFDANRAEDGGAVYAADVGSLVVEECSFKGNAAALGSGGITALRCDALTVRRSTFTGNHSGSTGGAIGTASTSPQPANVILEDCSFEANGVGSFSFAEAVLLAAAGANHVRRCRFLDHASTSDQPALAGGPGVVVEDCLFARNRTGVTVGDAWTVRRCSFSENAWVGVSVSGAGNVLESSIVAASGIAAIGGAAPAAGLTVRDSLVQGGFPGVNVIDADPMFFDPQQSDYRLAPASPCIDQGHANDLACGVDLDHRPRNVAGALNDAARVDMGAHEFSHVDLAVTKLGPLSFQIDSTGTTGLPTLLFVGLGPAEICLPPAGTLLVDLAQPWLLVPWALLPSSVTASVPAVPGLPPALWIQQIALGPTAGTGNLSGAAVLGLP